MGPCGYASRQDVLVAADMDTVSERADFEAWAACRKAEKAKKDALSNGAHGGRGKNNSSGEGRT